MPNGKEIKINNYQRLFLKLSGIVQGVGLRPAVYQFAQRLKLAGRIQNCGDQVIIILEGRNSLLEKFRQELLENLPIKSDIQECIVEWRPARGLQGLLFEKSISKNIQNISIPPDLVVCESCLAEFYDVDNRRYLYPFIACTDCGPRFSIVEQLPYDRENTSMKTFPFCTPCTVEYTDPLSRRFHAQNFACYDCGPKIMIANNSAVDLSISSPPEQIDFIQRQLKAGAIVAIKGVGGYQLVCDARSIHAIKKLRTRKARPHQAFAVMVKNEESLREKPAIIKLLKDPAGPLVIAENDYALPVEYLAPDSRNVALFLPSSPLHHYLFGAGLQDHPLEFLVVTSGNKHAAPMAKDEASAFSQLAHIADFFVTHNREIVRCVDDSLVNPQGAGQIWRNSRGHAPTSITVENKLKAVIAFGADLQNTFCLAKGSNVFFSAHIGDLIKADVYKHFVASVDDFLKFTQFQPQLVAIDSHPAYMSSSFGKDYAQARGLPIVEIQHHLAHGVSVLSENNLSQGIVLAFDGTGHGDDGTLWGGECLIVDLIDIKYQRIASLELSTLLGGSKAILAPIRQIYARLREANINFKENPQWEMLYQRKHLFPQTSSVGRLFDAVSAYLLPQYHSITYSAQAAIGLQTLAQRGTLTCEYTITWDGMRAQTSSLITQIFNDKKRGTPVENIAYNFHYALATIALQMAQRASAASSLQEVCLTGGVFQNNLLSRLVRELLHKKGFIVYTSRRLPPGDGGLCLGQAVYASLYHQQQEQPHA